MLELKNNEIINSTIEIIKPQLISLETEILELSRASMECFYYDIDTTPMNKVFYNKTKTIYSTIVTHLTYQLVKDLELNVSFRLIEIGLEQYITDRIEFRMDFFSLEYEFTSCFYDLKDGELLDMLFEDALFDIALYLDVEFDL